MFCSSGEAIVIGGCPGWVVGGEDSGWRSSAVYRV
jgi:hypothetical protein